MRYRFFHDRSVDLSEFTYARFRDYFFRRPVFKPEEAFHRFRDGVSCFRASRPNVVLGHVTTMCLNFRAIARRYSREQMEQGLWAMLSSDINCPGAIFQPYVDLDVRTRCIQSMYFVFRDVVALHQSEDGAYFMWWDLILHGTPHHLWKQREGRTTLTPDEEVIFETIYRTLCRILDIDHSGCQRAALHGMGHMHHPEKQERIREFLERHGANLSERDRAWIRGCADGKIM